MTDPSQSGGGKETSSSQELMIIGGASSSYHANSWLKQQLQACASFDNGTLLSSDDLSILDNLPPQFAMALGQVFSRLNGFQERNTDLILELKKIKSDHDRLLQERVGMRERMDAAEEDQRAAEAQLASYLEEGRETRRLWQEEREQLKVQNMKLLHRDTQYQAAMRKREKDYEKLQNLLSGAQTKGAKGSTVRSIDISPKPLPPSCHSSTSKNDVNMPSEVPNDEVTALTLLGYQRREAELLQENAGWRSMLKELYEQVKSVRAQLGQIESLRYSSLETEKSSDPVKGAREVWVSKRTSNSSAQTPGGSTTTPHSSSRHHRHSQALPEAWGGMPIDWLERHVGENLRSDLMELQARMQKMLDGWQTSSDRTEALVGDDTEALSAVNQGLRMEVNQMRQKLLEAEDVILQQDKVIQRALFEDHGLPAGAGADPTLMEEEREEMRREKELLQMQRKNMDKERNLLRKMVEDLHADWALDDLSKVRRYSCEGQGSSPLPPFSPKRFLSEITSSPILRLRQPEPHVSGHHSLSTFATPEIVRNLNFNISPLSPLRHSPIEE